MVSWVTFQEDLEPWTRENINRITETYFHGQFHCSGRGGISSLRLSVSIFKQFADVCRPEEWNSDVFISPYAWPKPKRLACIQMWYDAITPLDNGADQVVAEFLLSQPQLQTLHANITWRNNTEQLELTEYKTWNYFETRVWNVTKFRVAKYSRQNVGFR